MPRRMMVVVVVFLSLLSILPSAAQNRFMVIRGRLAIMWGDTLNGRARLEKYTVYGQDGHAYQLDLNETQKAQLGFESGVEVEIEVSVAADINKPLAANTVRIASHATTAQSAALQDSPRRYQNILCSSPGTMQFPHDPTYYQELMGAGSLFWDRTARVKFESYTTSWVALQQPIASFLTTDINGTVIPMFQPLAEACVQAAQGQINDPTVDGINFFFSEDIGCCAWGGQIDINMGQGVKRYADTFMPPWVDLLATLGHELGHSIGLPHSGGVGGEAYGNRFDLMSDLWTDCARAIDVKWGCMPQGTIFPQLLKLGAIDPARFTTFSSPTDQPAYFTVLIASLYRPSSELPSDYVYGVNVDESKYGGEFGLTVEYRDNRPTSSYSYDQKLPVRGIVIHERNEFGRPDPDHLLVSGQDTSGLIWPVGSKLTYSFATVCVLKETEFGAQVSIGVNGADCANPPPPVVGKATGLVLHDLAIVVTENIDVATLPQEIVVGIYREEKPVEKLMAVVTLNITPYQLNQYVGAWDKCDKAGDYYIKGAVGRVNISKSIIHLSCGKTFVPLARG